MGSMWTPSSSWYLELTAPKAEERMHVPDSLASIQRVFAPPAAAK